MAIKATTATPDAQRRLHAAATIGGTITNAESSANRVGSRALNRLVSHVAPGRVEGSLSTQPFEHDIESHAIGSSAAQTRPAFAAKATRAHEDRTTTFIRQSPGPLVVDKRALAPPCPSTPQHLRTHTSILCSDRRPVVPNATGTTRARLTCALMTSVVLQPSDDAQPAAWLVNSSIPWDRLASFGPPAFDAYARLWFGPGPDGQTNGPASRTSTDHAKVQALCELLHAENGTPLDCYFAIWDGWPDLSEVVQRSPRIHIPHRAYCLLRGSLTDFDQWHPGETGFNLASFIWPADHAWCIASDVDHGWAGIGAGTDTIERLLSQSRLNITAADPEA